MRNFHRNAIRFGAANHTIILLVIGTFTLTACLSLQAASEPLVNTATNPAITFRAIADSNMGCDQSAEAPFGEMTYSGLVRITDNRWVYLRDTKICIRSLDLSTEYFGILQENNGSLTASEVQFDLGQVRHEDRPTDLEALCLLPGRSSPADDPGFEMIAAESGGYDPENTRRLFRLEFSLRAGHWHARMLGKPANYHSVLQQHSDVTGEFQTEGMLCSTTQQQDVFSITLAGRGRHVKTNDTWVSRQGGGLVPLTVDFSARRPTVTVAGTASEFLEIVAPACSIPDGWSVAEGEWRDIADLYRASEHVWAVSTFEGRIRSDSSPSSEQEHFCSVIYQLCDRTDCSDLYQSAASRAVFGIEIQNRKIEGITSAGNKDNLSLASDEETVGAIDLKVPLTCPSDNCVFPLRVIRRTADLASAVNQALVQRNSGKVLVVFDIDDTLLTMTQDLGSVAWYKWQNQINKGAKPEHRDGQILRVGRHTGELLTIQGILYSLADMRATQDNTRELVVDQLAAKGIASFALTARGPQFENATRHELAAAGIEFPLAPDCVGLLCRQRGIIDGQHVMSAITTMLGPQVAATLRSTRDINIDNGVMMVSGQDKGVMIRLLLANFSEETRFDSIVFVDDDLPNVVSVADAARSMNEHVSVFHYTRYENNVQDFLANKGNRQDAAATAWQDIRDALCRQAPMRWCAYPTP